MRFSKSFFLSIVLSLFLLIQANAAVLYLRSTDGDDASDGSTWALAKATLSGAYTAASAGDTIYVSDNHAETQDTAMTLTSPGTAASPCKVLCVDDAAEPPITMAATATISTTGASSIIVAGFAFYRGITFNIGSGASLAYLSTGSAALPYGITFDTCSIYIVTTNTSSRIIFGSNSSVGDDAFFRVRNSTLGFNHTLQGIYIGGSVEFIGSTIGAYSATYPTTLFLSVTGYKGAFIAVGSNFAALAAGHSLVTGSGSGRCDYQFSNCALGASVAVLADAIAGPGGNRVFLDVCDSADPSSGPRSEVYTYQGSVITDTAIVRTGGASDGTAYSLKMTPNAAGVSFISPLVTRPIYKAIGAVGSPITVTAHLAMEEGATPLQEGNCWMEVEAMTTAGSTLTSFTNDNNSTILSQSTTDQTTSTETWTGFTGTPVKQQVACTFTPAEKGYYMVRIYLARPYVETTAPPVYVCSKLVVS